jgi:4-hydroxythreonine-4-phosphate dehydrogenase
MPDPHAVSDAHGRPAIGLMLGDRNGIGPEVALKLLADADVAEEARFVVVGDSDVLAHGRRVTGLTPLAQMQFTERTCCKGEPLGTGKVSAAAGAEVLDHLDHLLSLVRSRAIEGIVFAPLNKQAMRLGGLAAGDELDFIVERLGFKGNCGELNKLDALWTSRVTSHIPLRDVAGAITTPGVLAAVELAHSTLQAAGCERPRIAVAGLNPHAGDGGTFGDEEIRVIAPAVAQACAAGIDAKGPFPCDTVFVAAQAGTYDAVVSMYHDQGQIAMKLMGFGRGVTVMGGLPVPIATAAHGTAYDIAGRNLARADGMRAALRVCVDMAKARRHR